MKLVLAALVALGGTAAADPRAEMAVAEGQALLAAGRDRGACARFEAGYRLDPRNIPALTGLGDCNAHQDKLATAARWYRRAIAISSELHAGAGQDPLRERLVAIIATIPVAELTFSQDLPADAQVLLDGETVDRTDFPNLELDPGHRTLELVGRDLARTRLEVDAERGDRYSVTLVVAKAPPPVFVDRGRTRRRVGLAVVGGGLGLLGATVWYNVHTQHLFEDAQISHDDGIRRLRYVGSALFVAGAAAIATGVYLHLTAPGVERVAVAPSGNGIVVAGRF